MTILWGAICSILDLFYRITIRFQLLRRPFFSPPSYLVEWRQELVSSKNFFVRTTRTLLTLLSNDIQSVFKQSNHRSHLTLARPITDYKSFSSSFFFLYWFMSFLKESETRYLTLYPKTVAAAAVFKYHVIYEKLSNGGRSINAQRPRSKWRSSDEFRIYKEWKAYILIRLVIDRYLDVCIDLTQGRQLIIDNGDRVWTESVRS